MEEDKTGSVGVRQAAITSAVAISTLNINAAKRALTNQPNVMTRAKMHVSRDVELKGRWRGLTQKNTNTLPVLGGIVLWQTNTNSEDLDTKNDSRNLLDLVITPAPSLVLIARTSLLAAIVWVQPAKHSWTKKDADEKCQWRFRQMKAVSDEGSEEAVDNQEG